MKQFLLPVIGFVLAGNPALQAADSDRADESSRHAELRLQYHIALAEAKVPLDQLGDFYESKLTELESEYQESGNLEGMLAVKEERDSFREEPTEVDDRYPELRKLQSIFLDARATRSVPFREAAARATAIYRDQLQAVIGQLTREGKLEAAVKVKEELTTAEEELEKLQDRSQPSFTASSPLGEEPDWKVVTEIFEAESFHPTPTTAGHGGGGDYRDLPEKPGILIGLELQYSQFNEFETVRGIVPIFLTESGRKEGEDIRGFKKGRPRNVIAKRGYAVSRLDVFGTGTAIRRAKITFARIKGTRLDLSDTYDSGWHGEYEEGSFSDSGSDGRFVVGLEGVSGMGIGTIRLLLGGEE